MRQRKVKNVETKINEVTQYYIADARLWRGRWHELFGNDGGVYLEIGCGKGNFILAKARAHPDQNFVGIEGQPSVVFRAMQKLAATELTNVRLTQAFVRQPGEWFAAGELSGLYLNFSDPWQKKRHAHRRLTHRAYWRQYGELLRPGGTIEIKTDDEAFFAFMEAEARAVASDLFQIAQRTEDLHQSALEAKGFRSEYEDKFCEAGKRIKYAQFVRL